MNTEEFIEEVKKSDIIPDNFIDKYNEFQKYQEKALLSLKAFHKVCEDNKIPYQLAYGSLLGAIRVDGQIPWDYDVDVFVPYCEKDKLIKALKNSLPNQYYFYCPEVDSRCRHFMMRLAPKGYRSEVLHVDVFYIIGAPEDNINQFSKDVYKMFNTRYAKLVNIKEECHGRIKTFVKLMLMRLKYLGVSLERLERRYEEYCTQYDFYKTKYSISVDDDCVKRYYETEEMWDTILYRTSNGIFRIPKNCDERLTAIYGDYDQILPLRNRIDEFLESYNKFKRYEKCN